MSFGLMLLRRGATEEGAVDRARLVMVGRFGRGLAGGNDRVGVSESEGRMRARDGNMADDSFGCQSPLVNGCLYGAI